MKNKNSEVKDNRIYQFRNIEKPEIIRKWYPGHPYWPDYQQWLSYHITSGMYEPIIEDNEK